MAERMSSAPDASFPDALSEAELEGCYRFFSNPKVTPAAILAPHVQETLRRVADELVTLVVHDSSKLSFNSEGYRDGLMPISDRKQQFVVHCSLAVSADGNRRPQGVLAASHHVPVRSTNGKFQDRWGAHVLDVHSLGLSPVSVVHVMDREADDYEVLELIKSVNGRFVIRMQHNRAIVEEGRVRDALVEVRARAERTVPLSKRGDVGGAKQRKTHPARAERLANLSFGARSIDIKRTSSAANATTNELQLNVVYVWESAPPEGEAAIEWVLYTSEPIENAEQILRVVDWYRARWVIEEYFKALKTGCALEKRQLGDFHALTNALALLMPIAWQLLLLRNEARDRPEAPASDTLLDDELQVLRAAARKPLPQHPTIRDAVLAIAALGGHLKRNGAPGWQTLARGHEKLRGLVAGWRLRIAVETGTLPQSWDQS
jgi:hypothetical protein